MIKRDIKQNYSENEVGGDAPIPVQSMIFSKKHRQPQQLKQQQDYTAGADI